MSKYFFILLILFCTNLFSQENTQKIQGSKELPQELNLLLESLQGSASLNESQLNSIMHIDSYARILSKEDIFLIGKIEIYKTLLKPDAAYPKAVVDGFSLKTLKDALKNTKDPFVSWFLKALLNDCETLLATPAFKDYLLQKNAGRLERLEARKIDKKVQLLYRWISKINPSSTDFEDNLKVDLLPVMAESLKNIEQSFFLMASETLFQPLAPLPTSVAGLKFFSAKAPKKKAAKTPPKEKTIDEILAPVTGEGVVAPKALPEPSSEDWLNEDDAPANLKNLPKPSDDADWLQDF